MHKLPGLARHADKVVKAGFDR